MDAIRARTMTTVHIRIFLLEERFVEAITAIVTGGAGRWGAMKSVKINWLPACVGRGEVEETGSCIGNDLG